MPSLDDWASDFSDQIPIYAQIVQQFKARVASGSLKQGERLPSIRDLAIILRVNPNTVMRAYQELERSGLIRSQRGMGFFVDDESGDAIRRDMAHDAAQRYAADMQLLGFTQDMMIENIKEYLKERGNAINEYND